MPLTSDEEQNNSAVADKLYNLVLLPLLEGAVESGATTNIPMRDQLIEKAHILPGKSGEHKLIIAQFYNQELRAVCFQHKKDYASRVQASSATERIFKAILSSPLATQVGAASAPCSDLSATA